MFITLPPDVVFNFENTLLQRPQHQELIFIDPDDGNLWQRYTIYTGELFDPSGEPLLNAGSSHKDLTFLFPLLGTFYPNPAPPPPTPPPPPPPPGGGSGFVGIKQIDEDSKHNTIRSAVAEAAVTSAEWGSNPVWADITAVSADVISQIQLDGLPDPINAVALSGMLTSRNSQIKRISYRVTVLERQSLGNHKFLPTILKGFAPPMGGPTWTGAYSVPPGGSGTEKREGLPQDKIDWL